MNFCNLQQKRHHPTKQPKQAIQSRKRPNWEVREVQVRGTGSAFAQSSATQAFVLLHSMLGSLVLRQRSNLIQHSTMVFLSPTHPIQESLLPQLQPRLPPIQASLTQIGRPIQASSRPHLRMEFERMDLESFGLATQGSSNRCRRGLP